jgi:hypothetical protein
LDAVGEALFIGLIPDAEVEHIARLVDSLQQQVTE